MKFTLYYDSVQNPWTYCDGFQSVFEAVAHEEKLTAMSHWSGGKMWTNFRLVKN
jgi:hypothetical protein